MFLAIGVQRIVRLYNLDFSFPVQWL
jgi:hypothetical protein